MKRLVLSSLLALPILGLSENNASAFFCFQGTCNYKIGFPRIVFGIDTGCAAPYGPSMFNFGHPGHPHGPWYQHFPHGGPHTAQPAPQPGAAPQGGQQLPAPRPATGGDSAPAPTTQPTSYYPASYSPASYYQPVNYQYYTPNSYAVPAYWYGR